MSSNSFTSTCVLFLSEVVFKRKTSPNVLTMGSEDVDFWVHYLAIIMMNGSLWHLHQSAWFYKCNHKPTTHLIHSKYALMHGPHRRKKRFSAYYTLFASCVFSTLSDPEWITSVAVENSINKHKDLQSTFPFIHTLKVKQVKKKKEAVADTHAALLLPFSESVMLKVKNSNRRTIQV